MPSTSALSASPLSPSHCTASSISPATTSTAARTWSMRRRSRRRARAIRRLTPRLRAAAARAARVPVVERLAQRLLDHTVGGEVEADRQLPGVPLDREVDGQTRGAGLADERLDVPQRRLG